VKQTESSIEDPDILEIAKQLCKKMGIESVPNRVEWRYLLPGGSWARTMQADECVVTPDSILLPSKMRRQLEPRLWKPLIASSLVFTHKLSARIFRHRMKWFLFGLLPVLLFDFLIYRFLLQNEIGIYAIGFVAFSSLLLLIALVLVSSMPLVGRSMLTADLEAANLEEGGDLLLVLRKIDSLSFENSSRHHSRILGRFVWKPSLTKRIDNLELMGANP